MKGLLYHVPPDNPQGLALAPDGTVLAHEHGPQGGDEINLIAPGCNHGWPVITFGENYGGGPIGAGLSAKNRHDPTAALLGALDCALGHGVCHQHRSFDLSGTMRIRKAWLRPAA